MTAITVSVSCHFSAGHRILGLDGPASKCANLHGHTFGVEVEVVQDRELGVEFTRLKEGLFGWIKQNLDHGYIVHQDDRVLLDFLTLHRLKCYVTPKRPTTEEIALVIMHAAQTFVDQAVHSVRVTEGPHNAATVYP